MKCDIEASLVWAHNATKTIPILSLFLLLITVSILIFPSEERSGLFHHKADLFRGDEVFYRNYAMFINQNGVAGIREIFNIYVSNKKFWLYPNPLRVGFILTSALWMRCFGDTFIVMTRLSFFSYLVYISITYLFCRKHFGNRIAPFTAMLLAFSPINMAMARRPLADSMATMLIGLCVWLFLDVAQKRANVVKKCVFALAFSLTILVKESSVILMAPFIIYALIPRGRLLNGPRLKDFLYITVYPLAMVFLVYLISSGGFLKTFIVVKIILASPGTNEYAIRYGSGPWFRYLLDFMMLSPWTLLLCIGYTFHILAGIKRADSKEIYFLVIFLTLFAILNLFTKNIRYVMALDTPIKLFSVLMILKLFSSRSARFQTAAVTVTVVLICAYDYLTFRRLFIMGGIHDPVSMTLLRGLGIIPPN